jgi:energy-dependent translational throttle protein EttA
MAHEFIFTVQNLRKLVDGRREIIKDLTLAFLPGAKIGVIGGNGAGKSTLLRIMAGVDQDFDGQIWHPPGIKIGYLAQEPELDASRDVRGNVMEAVAEQQQMLQRFEELTGKLAEELPAEEMDQVMDEYGKVQDEIDACGAWELDRTLDVAMDALRLPPGDMDVTNLSGGERRRVALCKVLLAMPDLLLLDEPTNHLDAESVAWLERHLASFPGTVIAVTHDRYFLDNVAGWILEMDRGVGHPFEGNYSGWLDQKHRRIETDEKHSTARSKTLARELEWVRSSVKARQDKSKARLKAYEELLAIHDAEKGQATRLELIIPPGPRLGDEVVVADGLSKGYGDRLLFENLTFRIPPAGIAGVIGGNGAGKTTLFKLITGQEQPDAGKLKLGQTVTISYVDQSRETLDGEKTVWDEIADGLDHLKVGRQTLNSRAYVNAFGFKGSQQQKRVKDLSGGERNRVHLAKLLKSGGNLLLLDEPTNDLDVDTLRVLEEALLQFGGSAMIISHDRWFLDRIATHILAFEGDSQAFWFEGNYEMYETDRRRRLGEIADRPHRMTYKKLIKG